MYSNIIKERNNDFNFIPPLEKVEPKICCIFLNPPLRKVVSGAESQTFQNEV